jgi:signal transduction histidine kinase
VLLQAELRRSIRESANRLKEIVDRMQRFTNLDRAEVQEANVNDLLTDVVALAAPDAETRARLELKLTPLPSLPCHPQQLSAVFSSLVNNAMDAVNGQGRVTVATRAVNGTLEIAIADTGSGLDAAQAATIFDPAFKASGGRIGTGNWSMFSARQIVRQHGGDIRVSSAAGRGTTVYVTLPITTAAKGMSVS